MTNILNIPLGVDPTNNVIHFNLADAPHMLCAGTTGCLSGDTVVNINRGGNGRKYKISDLEYMQNGGKRGGKIFDHNIKTYISRAEDEVSKLGELNSIWKSGTKFTYVITTGEGRQIRATADHRFFTDKGVLKLSELSVGMMLQVNSGRSCKTPKKKNQYRMVETKFHPYQTNGDSRKRQTPAKRVPRHRAVMEAHINNLPFDEYLRILRTNIDASSTLNFLPPDEYHVHHIDENPHNNDISNLQIHSISDHHKLHAEQGSQNHVLWQISLDRISTIVPYGYEETYDIEVSNDPHNFIANDFVVHNSGKSTALHSIICSLLMKTTPDDLMFMLIDSKMVELTVYDGIPNLLCPCITDAWDAIDNLKALVATMEQRYKLAQDYGAKDLIELNEKLPPGQKLPYILVVVDEVADLMALSKNEVEESIVRIAQKARACGIHLIVATQSPRREIITGLLKCNLPSRIGFSTTSSLDSRIIGVNGCENLLGSGDMLFSNQGRAPIRLQSPYISSKEINSIVNFWRGQIYWHDKVAA